MVVDEIGLSKGEASSKNLQKHISVIWNDICHGYTESYALSERKRYLRKRIYTCKESGEIQEEIVYERISPELIPIGGSWEKVNGYSLNGNVVYRQFNGRNIPTGYYKVDEGNAASEKELFFVRWKKTEAD